MDISQVKLLFINPCIRRNAPTKVMPVGLCYVMTFLEEKGYKFDLLDLDLIEQEDDFVENYIRNNSYDFILFGSIVTHWKWIKWLTKTIKKHQPTCKVIVGNSVGGSLPEVFLKNAPADAVVIGEGEYTTFEALESLRQGKNLNDIPGVAFLDSGGNFVKTLKRKACNINELPLPNWDHFDLKGYVEKSGHYITFGKEYDAQNIAIPVSTARGCAFRCTFCHFVYWDDPYRFRSPENILKEIKRNMDKYGQNYVPFWDDLSFAHFKQVEQLCDAIIESGLKFNWMASIRSDLLGKPKYPREKRVEVAHKMKKAGCVSTGFSLESGNKEILKMMNKKVEPEYFLEQVKILREAGIVCNTSVVFGYPIETRETIKDTFDFCLKAKTYPSIGFLLPLPYTQMWDYAVEKKLIVDQDKFLDSITERQDICLNMTNMTDEEIMDEIKIGAQNLNEKLQLGFDESRLVRTGGYKKATNLKRYQEDTEEMKRNENDFSFNYSESVFQTTDDLGNTYPKKSGSSVQLKK